MIWILKCSESQRFVRIYMSKGFPPTQIRRHNSNLLYILEFQSNGQNIVIILNDFRSSTKLANQFRTNPFKIIDPKFIIQYAFWLHLGSSQNDRGQNYKASNIDVGWASDWIVFHTYHHAPRTWINHSDIRWTCDRNWSE